LDVVTVSLGEITSCLSDQASKPLQCQNQQSRSYALSYVKPI